MTAATVSAGVALVLVLAIGGCGGGASNRSIAPTPGSAPTTAIDGTTNFQVTVWDQMGTPIEGAMVTVTAGGSDHQQTTNAQGTAEITGLPVGEGQVSISATGFETQTSTTVFEGGSHLLDFWMVAEGAWAIGRPIVLGTTLLDRASDGSSMIFSVDLTVIDENLEALQTLTSADFPPFNQNDDWCGWLGPRDCASSAEGIRTGGFTSEGGALAFEYRPAGARAPYLVGVLVERSADRCWTSDPGRTALQAFFSQIGGNDSASLMTVQTEAGNPTLTVLGPFTNNGAAYVDSLDQLTCPETSQPAVLESLRESIRLAAMADDLGLPDVERHVLMLGTPDLTVSEVEEIAEYARASGVRISSISFPSWERYGLPEAAVRTGGFVSHIHDPRQLGMVFGALDRLLAGTLPTYRMQFRLIGKKGTFVSGGNAKVILGIDLPTSIPYGGTYASLDVAIP